MHQNIPVGPLKHNKISLNNDDDDEDDDYNNNKHEK
jgi:hypothetical protein